MGLKQHSSSGLYVKLKDGKFYLPNDDTNTPYDELEGKLTDLYIKDETYEGKPVRKLYLVMTDGAENLIVNFRFDSRYTSNFINFAKNIDLSDKFTLCPVVKDKVAKDGTTVKEAGVLIKQDGTFAKSFYTKDKPNGLPQMVQKKMNGTMVWDKGDILEFYENVVENELKPQLPRAEAKTVIKDEAPTKTNVIVDENEDDEDDLPWNK